MAMFVVSGCSTKSARRSYRRLKDAAEPMQRLRARVRARMASSVSVCLAVCTRRRDDNLQQFDNMHTLVVDSVLITIAVDDVRVVVMRHPRTVQCAIAMLHPWRGIDHDRASIREIRHELRLCRHPQRRRAWRAPRRRLRAPII